MKKNSICIIGKLRGSNRSQILINELKNIFPNQVFWEYDSHPVVRGNIKIRARIYNKTLRTVKSLYNLITANKIIYLAMNDESIWKLVFARIMGKSVIVDFYTSRYYFNCIATKRSHKNDNSIHPIKKIKMLIVDFIKLKIPNKVVFLGSPDILFHSNFFRVGDLSKRSYILPLVVPDLFDMNAQAFNNIKSGVINVCWWGKASYFHGIEYILSEFESSCNKINNINLYFFDDCPKREKYIKNLIKLHPDVEKFIYVNSRLTMKNGLSGWLQNNCHISLGPLGFTSWSQNAIPNKLVESWMLKIPIITQDNKALNEYQDACFAIKHKSLGELSNMLTIVANDIRLNFESNIEPVVNKGRYIYEKEHSIKAFKSGLEKILNP